ncbi:RloB family protein [Sphingobacterium siyangense]|uniref:RloB family protein n=1 Tax=Sphingobacterium siyangense TaxID=459529 RepID=UPI00301ADA10
MKRRVASTRRVLILCEGFTEEVYAKSLRSAYLPRDLQRVVNVDVVRHKKNDPLNLIAEAKERVSQAKKEKVPYKDVWLFFDHDNSPHLQKVFEEVERQGFNLAFTAISIEYWFILHFEDCGRSFANGDECLKYLKKHWVDYHKTKVNHFEQLGNYINDAIVRAQKLEKRNEGISILDQQPYTSVHKLIAFFKELGGQI